MLIAPAVPFDRLLRNGIVKNVEEVTIFIVSIADLIALKEAAGGPVDLDDIEALKTIVRLGLDR